MPRYTNLTSKHHDSLLIHDVIVEQVGSDWWAKWTCTAATVMTGEAPIPFDTFSSGEVITCLMCLGLASLRRRGGLTRTGSRIGY